MPYQAKAVAPGSASRPGRTVPHDPVTAGGSTPDPAADARIAAVTVGEPTRIDGPIHLAESDPEWPHLAVREAERIRSILGAQVRRLEHVGSTSVDGLAAKPIIDLVLAVPDSADEGSYLPALETAGYTLCIREPDWFEHRVFKGPDTDINLHVFSEGASEIDRMVAFRDHLRADPSDLERYAAVKLELATQTWRYVQDYADAKSAVVAEIMTKAVAARTPGGGDLEP
jgi:GrpB-like predicted nucleotidyltransferase (UPF0157 family)